MDYTITLTDTEKKSMEYVCADVKEWITNSAQNRARKSKEAIIALLIAHCNANSISIAVGEDAQVTQAYSLGIIKTAAEINAENLHS
jgi:hypothetical protein